MDGLNSVWCVINIVLPFLGYLDEHVIDDDDDDDHDDEHVIDDDHDDDDDEGLARWVGLLFVVIHSLIESCGSCPFRPWTVRYNVLMRQGCREKKQLMHLQLKNKCRINFSLFKTHSSRVLSNCMPCLCRRCRSGFFGFFFTQDQSLGLSACFGNCTVSVAASHPRPQPLCLLWI